MALLSIFKTAKLSYSRCFTRVLFLPSIPRRVSIKVKGEMAPGRYSLGMSIDARIKNVRVKLNFSLNSPLDSAIASMSWSERRFDSSSKALLLSADVHRQRLSTPVSPSLVKFTDDFFVFFFAYCLARLQSRRGPKRDCAFFFFDLQNGTLLYAKL